MLAPPAPFYALTATAQADLARLAVEPIAHWIPPILQTVLMLAFALGWRRAESKREAERKESETEHAKSREQADALRTVQVTTAIDGLKTTLAEIRLQLTSFVTVERHSASVRELHEKFNKHGRQLAVLLHKSGVRMPDNEDDAT